MKRLALLILLLALLACIAPQARAGTLAQEQDPRTVAWAADLDLLEERLLALREAHGAPLAAVSTRTLTSRIDALKARTPAMSDTQLAVGVMEIMALYGVAHTGVSIYWWEAAQARLPIRVQWFRDGLFVTGAQPGYEDLLGARVTAIGRATPTYALSRLRAIIPSENDYRVRAASTEYLVRPAILDGLGLSPGTTGARFAFWTPAGGSFARDLPAAHVSTFAAWSTHPGATALSQQHGELYYWYTYIADSETLYLQYNACGERDDLPWGAFLGEIAGVIASNPVDRYIIDMRSNGGGYAWYANALMEHLAAHPQFAKNGKLFVLVGNQTYSSAVYYAHRLRSEAGAVLVGEPTGQGANFYAGAVEVALPNSRLPVSVALSRWEFAPATTRALYPDVWISARSYDYFDGRDRVLTGAMSR